MRLSARVIQRKRKRQWLNPFHEAWIKRTGAAVSAIALLTVAQAAAASPSRAQGADDFLRDINSVGIGSPSDSKNFDLVGFGNALCWRLYSGEAPSSLVDSVVTDSRSSGAAGLTPQQAEAAVGFARSDLCPDAAQGR